MLKSEIEENKKRYWEKRNLAEAAWNDFVESIQKDQRWVAMKAELDQINDRIAYPTKYYLCKYEIHPDDCKITDFNSDDRGGYRDTMYRSDHFGCPLVVLRSGQTIVGLSINT